MNGEVFFDSNVLLYLLSPIQRKADRAEEVISGGGTISVQVLNEFANVATRKFGASFAKLREMLAGIRMVCTVKSLDVETHELALDIAERYRFDIYDSLIVAAALQARCSVLYTEDLQDGQEIDGLTVRNPFTS